MTLEYGSLFFRCLVNEQKINAAVERYLYTYLTAISYLDDYLPTEQEEMLIKSIEKNFDLEWFTISQWRKGIIEYFKSHVIAYDSHPHLHKAILKFMKPEIDQYYSDEVFGYRSIDSQN